jgi:Histidine kinase-, DNA gyrase B-, and HSP90-like ATPase
MAATQDATPTSERRLKMQYAGGLVKHLGLSMYRGAVPAIAELVSNAWDADATKAAITVPFGTGLKDQQIQLQDDGCGMTWEEVDKAYLVVGRDRRKVQGEKTSGGRVVMGRKGLGKLAGFGIARIVEVRTVRNGWLTHFAMDFEQMTKGGQAEMVENYEPTIIEDHETQEGNGTSILLRDLLISRPIDEKDFRRSMSRRFSILGKGFLFFGDLRVVEKSKMHELSTTQEAKPPGSPTLSGGRLCTSTRPTSWIV